MGQQVANTARNRAGQIVGSRGLTDRQRAWAQAYVLNGCQGNRASEAAGYAEPKSSAFFNRNNPAVMAEVRRLQIATVRSEGAVVGYRVLKGIAQDEDAPAGARVMAAKALMAAAEIGSTSEGAAFDVDKPMAQWSVSELSAFIEAAEGAQRAAQGQLEPEGAVTTPEGSLTALEHMTEGEGRGVIEGEGEGEGE